MDASDLSLYYPPTFHKILGLNAEMAMSGKTILTCAISGSSPAHPRYPAELRFPNSPAEIAEAAVVATRAGASIVHIHAREGGGIRGGSRDPRLFKEIVDRIRDQSTDVVINLTCGHGATWFCEGDDGLGRGEGTDLASVAERTANIETCLPELCSLDITTANQVENGRDYVYFNPAHVLRKMAERFQKLGVKPELECFGPGDVLFGRQLIEEGLVGSNPLFQLVLGVKWGAPATPESVTYLRNMLPLGAHWTAFGISRDQMPMVAQAWLLGGNIRVGLEDNLYLSRGVFATNPQLVERAARIVTSMGGSIATPAEAREILKLRKRNH
jgi:uncharacterized protein (DUF849 family)